MTLVAKQNIFYRLRAFFIIICVIMLSFSSAGIVYHPVGDKFHLPCVILTVFLGLFCIYEITISCLNIIYKDLFVLIGNVNAIVHRIIILKIFNRLHNYVGIYVNIKETKYVNQRYGTSIGDVVIQKYAKCLDQYVKKHSGLTGRLGGDNFFVLIKKDEHEDFLKFLDNINIDIQLPIETVKIHVKYRAGVNIITPEIPLHSIIFYSSIALTEARERGETFVVFDEQMLLRYSKEHQLVTDSRRAIKEGEFVPYYQPKVNAKTKELCGCEALVRWISNGKMICPGDFVPALEKAGAITEIDFCVFEMVCRDIRDWIDRGIEPVKISTNFSKLHLKDPDFINRIIRIKEKYNIDGKYLEVELTESAGITNFDVIKKFSQEIREAGMCVSIDDFGTGYSSLSMLQSIKADVVKMDKSFLDNCFNDDSKQFIIDIITIVKHQNQQILFEGVETKEQLDFLLENGVDIIQGFYFDKPLCHTEYEKRLNDRYYK